MKLHARLARLEHARPAQHAEPLALELAPDLAERIEAAQSARTFPQSLSDNDLQALIEAADKAKEGSHDRP